MSLSEKEKISNINDFLGVHSLKAFSLIILCLTHVYSWMSEAHQLPLGLTDFHSLQIMIDLFSPLFQILAGFTLASVFLENNSVNKSNYNIVNMATYLVTLETIKSGITYGWEHVLIWGALHTIALASIVIYYTARKSIHLVTTLMIGVAYIVSEYKNCCSAKSISDEKIYYLLKSDFSSQVFFLFASVVFAIVMLKIYRTDWLKNNKIKMYIFSALSFLIISYEIFNYHCNNREVILEILTFKDGLMFGDEFGIQLYPFLIWFPKICAGFLTYYYFDRYQILNRISNKMMFLIGIIVLALLLWIIMYSRSGLDQMFELRKNIYTFWGGGVVRDMYPAFTLIITMLILLCGLFILGPIEKFFQNLRSNFSIFSRASLWIYFLITGPGKFIVKKIAYYFEFETGIIISMIVLMLFSYFVAKFTDFIGHKNIMLSLRKRSN